MISKSYIVVRPSAFVFAATAVMLFTVLNCHAQRAALLTPKHTGLCVEFASEVRRSLGVHIPVDDLDLSRTAERRSQAAALFNMTLTEARNLGEMLGTSYFALIDTNLQRRTSLEVEEYYEASAAIFLVSSTTGRLVDFSITSFKMKTTKEARTELLRSASKTAEKIFAAIEDHRVQDRSGAARVKYPDVPEAGTRGFEGLRPPMPYRRIRPEYTLTADLYGIKATVEIALDISSDGRIANAEIVRWAGYGLDESVERTARAMNWRPATLGDRALPMRVLLRYNFVKLEDDEDN